MRRRPGAQPSHAHRDGQGSDSLPRQTEHGNGDGWSPTHANRHTGMQRAARCAVNKRQKGGATLAEAFPLAALPRCGSRRDSPLQDRTTGAASGSTAPPPRGSMRGGRPGHRCSGPRGRRCTSSSCARSGAHSVSGHAATASSGNGPNRWRDAVGIAAPQNDDWAGRMGRLCGDTRDRQTGRTGR
jgi:hypothetical protein